MTVLRLDRAMMLIPRPRQEQIDELRKLVYVRSLLSIAYTRRLTITSKLSMSLAIVTTFAVVDPGA
jgi:hypothetical protein